jgi:hypothetical protein
MGTERGLQVTNGAGATRGDSISSRIIDSRRLVELPVSESPLLKRDRDKRFNEAIVKFVSSVRIWTEQVLKTVVKAQEILYNTCQD